MTEHVAVVRRPRGKGLRSKAAAKRKAVMGRRHSRLLLQDTAP